MWVNHEGNPKIYDRSAADLLLFDSERELTETEKERIRLDCSDGDSTADIISDWAKKGLR